MFALELQERAAARRSPALLAATPAWPARPCSRSVSGRQTSKLEGLAYRLNGSLFR